MLLEKRTYANRNIIKLSVTSQKRRRGLAVMLIYGVRYDCSLCQFMEVPIRQAYD